RTVSVPVESFAVASGPNGFDAAGGSLRAAAPITTPAVPVCSSIWSTMVAFSWRQDGNGDVGAPVRAASGARLSVLDDTDAQPNTNTPEYHADLQTPDLYWTGRSRSARRAPRL